MCSVSLTVTRRLDRSLNVADALDGDTVLVVPVDELVLELTDLVDENAELVGNVRDVIVAALTPDGELLLESAVSAPHWPKRAETHSDELREDLQQPPCVPDQRAPLIA